MSLKVAHYHGWVITANARVVELNSGRRIYEGHASIEQIAFGQEGSLQVSPADNPPSTYDVRGVFHTPLAAKNAAISVAKRAIDFI